VCEREREREREREKEREIPHMCTYNYLEMYRIDAERETEMESE